MDQFRRARFGLERSVVYWTDKAATTTTTDDDDGKRVARKLARAERNSNVMSTGVRSGWFHRRKGSELVNGPALVFDETVRVRGDCVVLPGGLKLTAVHAPALPDDGHVWKWTGAARIVDVTAKITARTGPEHRRYMVHLSAKAGHPPNPLSPSPPTRLSVLTVVWSSP